MKLGPEPELSFNAKIIATVIMIAVLLLIKVLWASWAYDDWTCAFKHCAQVQVETVRSK